MSLNRHHFWWLLLLTASLAGGPPDPPNRLYVVAVGIEGYQEAGKVESVPGADRDAARFRESLRPAGFSADRIRLELLQGPAATKVRIQDTLDRVLSSAGPNDLVYIFISARGITEFGSHDAYILAHDSQPDIFRGHAVAVKDMRAMIEASLAGSSKAGGIYVFADVCRQTTRPVENLIQDKLAALSSVGQRVRGILASESRRPSLDGIFAAGLAKGMEQFKADVPSNYGPLFSTVRTSVYETSKKAQRPMSVGAAPAKALLSWPETPLFKRLPNELALLGGPVPLLFAAQAPQAAAPLRARFLDELANDRLTGPGSASERLEAYQQAVPPGAAAEEIAMLRVALEDKAQQVIAVYGSGEQFPNDPLRLDAARFLEAADLFDRALRLSAASRQRELESRKWFCSGRAKLFEPPRYDLAGAAADFAKAISLYPDYPEPYNGLGIVHLEQVRTRTQPADQAREYDAAVAQFHLALDRAPEWAYAHHNLALAYVEKGEYREAERAYLKAIALAPYRPYLQYNLGFLLQRQNRPKEAEKQYLRAADLLAKQIELHRKEAGTYASLAASKEPTVTPGQRRQYQARSQFELKIAEALQQNLAIAYNAAGTVRDSRQDRIPAEGLYRKALDSNRQYPEASHNLAMLLMEMRRKPPKGRTPAALEREAIGLWQATLKIDPRHRPSLMGLARAYRAGGKFAEAVAEYRKVVTLDENQIQAREELALSLGASGQVEAAISEMEETIRRQKEAWSAGYATPAMHEALGEWYSRKQEPAASCRQFRMALEAAKATGSRATMGRLKKKVRACGAASGA